MSIHQQRLDGFCDRCPARFSVEVFLSGDSEGNEPDLKLCQHHYDQNAPALLAAGATVVKNEVKEPAKV